MAILKNPTTEDEQIKFVMSTRGTSYAGAKKVLQSIPFAEEYASTSQGFERSFAKGMERSLGQLSNALNPANKGGVQVPDQAQLEKMRKDIIGYIKGNEVYEKKAGWSENVFSSEYWDRKNAAIASAASMFGDDFVKEIGGFYPGGSKSEYKTDYIGQATGQSQPQTFKTGSDGKVQAGEITPVQSGVSVQSINGFYMVVTADGKKVRAQSAEGTKLLEGAGMGTSYNEIAAAAGGNTTTDIEANRLFQGIKAGKIQPGQDNPEWTALYKGGKATEAQKKAYGMWESYLKTQQGGDEAMVAPEEEKKTIDVDANKAQEDELDLIKSETDKVDLSQSESLTKKLLELLEDGPDVEGLDYSAEETLFETREELGVDELETSLNQADAQVEALDSAFMSTVEGTEQQRAPMGSIRRNLSETELQYNRQRRELVDARNAIADQLNTKYSLVETLMNARSTDYANATKEYNDRFNRSMQLIGLLDEEADEAQAMASANFSLFAEVNSGTPFEQLSVSDQVLFTKLAAGAGIPASIAEAMLLQSEFADIEHSSKRQEANGDTYLDVMTRDKETGKFEVESIYLGKSKVTGSGGSGPYTPGTDEEATPDWLQSLVDEYGNNEINEARVKSEIGAQTSKTTEYDYYLKQFYSLIGSRQQFGTEDIPGAGGILKDIGLDFDFEGKSPEEKRKAIEGGGSAESEISNW